eukprot:TRINITY_DN8359_c0_g1_i23.p2 TRINITY_DN8359_c0_g1~~TRINITY_DN8359_c0_g1_i23.p2  ORF type:complete len:259 (-),score=70.86 TRINITY_DN8359_c0_g1_i23:199-975(-)
MKRKDAFFRPVHNGKRFKTNDSKPKPVQEPVEVSDSEESDSYDAALAELTFEERKALRKFDNSGSEASQSSAKLLQDLREGKLKPKRKKTKKKDEPPEMSSKIPVSRKKQVIQTKKKISRDPRFDSLSGHFNEGLFKKSFSFLDEIVDQEMNFLKNSVETETDPDRRKKYQKALNILENKCRAKMEKEQTQQMKKKLRKQEEERIARGKTPFYFGKKHVEEEKLKLKYNKLKEKDSVDKFLKDRRRKIAQKQHVLVPK